MAFNIRNLQNLSGSGAGPKMFTYISATDNRAAVQGAGYFNPAATQFTVGDLLWIKSSDVAFFAQVSAISAGAVTIAATGAFV